MVQWIIAKAAEQACAAVYLHVITYNESAIAFYQRHNFDEIAELPNFYYIT